MGIEVSEPMVFGLGSGLYFVHLPFLKVNGKPAIGYRQWFVSIFRKSIERLGGKIALRKFNDEQLGMEALDQLLAQGKPAAVVTNVYYLDYLPEYFRFQFSGHNLVVYGKEQDEYLVSDPVIETLERVSGEQLQRARFAQASPRPKGKIYYIESMGAAPPLAAQIRKSIDEVCYNMTVPPLPWLGCNGIQLLAKKIKAYPRKYDEATINAYFSNIIQMQEVIGTGGAGFRFMYAAYLQEAGQLLQQEKLLHMAQEMTAIGDEWRLFASAAAKILKGRNQEDNRFLELSEMLYAIGDKERLFFKTLKKINQ